MKSLDTDVIFVSFPGWWRLYLSWLTRDGRSRDRLWRAFSHALFKGTKAIPKLTYLKSFFGHIARPDQINREPGTHSRLSSIFTLCSAVAYHTHSCSLMPLAGCMQIIRGIQGNCFHGDNKVRNRSKADKSCRRGTGCLQHGDFADRTVLTRLLQSVWGPLQTYSPMHILVIF